ncbi:MAG: matrixin family metalloprotease [Myxococcales bacterium]|jgi:tetratricopeptide (TPR) repeat protein
MLPSLRSRHLVACLLLAFPGCHHAPRGAERDRAAELEPIHLGAPQSPAAVEKARPLRLRLYVDPGYRALLHWRERIDALLERANAFVAPRFGVRFVAVDVKAWEPRTTTGDLRELLAELRQLEPDPDVDWAVGLTAGRPVVDLEELGMAWLLSDQFMVRAVDDSLEARALSRSLRSLPDADREALLLRRREHKELVVFLHEWGHTLGVPHMSGPGNVMTPSYSREQASFGPEGSKIVELALRHRLDPAGKPLALEAELAKYVEATPAGEWDPVARGELLAYLRHRLSGGAEPGFAGGGVTGADVAAFRAAVALADKGELEQAWSELAPVLARHRDEPAVVRFACQLASASKANLRRGGDACERAVRLAPEDPRARIGAGFVRAAAGDREGALKALLEARVRLDAAGTAARWLDVARLAHDLDAVSIAEAAAARCGGEGEPILEWAESTRRRMALPPDAERLGITAEREPSYVGLVREGLSHSAGKRLEDAAASAARLDAEYPTAPGARLVECAAAVARSDCAAARGACKAALERYEEAAVAHYQLGLCELHEGRLAEAQAAMSRVVELTPQVRSAWKNLSFILGMRDEIKQRRELEARYRARFGSAL